MEKTRISTRDTAFIRTLLARISCSVLALCIGHCASTGYTTYDIPCLGSRTMVLKEARSYLYKLGFQDKIFLPDSGYYRTRGLKVESVSETMGGGPAWYAFEIRFVDRTVKVGAFKLLPDRGNEEARLGLSPEDDSRTEQSPIKPGERFWILVVKPLLDHLTAYCGR